VLIAIFADIHANRQAFEACLARARDNGAQRYVLLGDYVGYGADPDWCLTRVMDLVADGALAVLGNHDSAIGNLHEHMNAQATMAIEWTRGVLDAGQRRFLADLPLTLEDEDRFYVHADASDPPDWLYVTGVASAAESLSATSAAVTFCGHVHQPALYTMSVTAKMTAFTPKTGMAVPLLQGRRWLAVLGSVGQPRDGNPAASYLMRDTDKNEITFCRAPYDVEAAAAAIRKQGLPTWLADRLFGGL
jgi:diadenosine tetraphosphatase ApaH/serine/threonine PP2A family protein phosphatase